MTQAVKNEPVPLSLCCTAEWEPVVAGEGQPALPRFRMVAYTGGAMRVSGWRFPIIVDLAGLSIPAQARPIRLGHDAAMGVGHTDSIRVEAGHLVAAGIVSRDTPSAREVVTSSRNGFPWQASIGASVEESEFVKEGQKIIVNGQEFSGPVNVVRKSTLGEISFVDLGADGNTSASVAANQSQEEETVKTENEGQNAPAVPAPIVAANTAEDVAAEIRAKAAAETERIAAIRKIFAGKFSDLEAKAIRENWDTDKCEVAKMRAELPEVPAVIVRQEPAINAHMLEARCAISGKLGNLEKHYDVQTLEAAEKAFRHFGLQDLILEAAWKNGYRERNFHDKRTALRFAFSHGLQAALSSIDLGGILSNVANKFLLEGFYSVERVWRNICAIRNVSDFKAVTSYRLTGALSYQKLAPGGEIKHGKLGNEKYNNKADTYALMLSISREDIVNDDLGAISDVPRMHGRGSGLTINDVFWTTFLNNAAFFTVGNKNFLAGADTALGISGMDKATVAFAEQVDPDNKPLGIRPAIILVPPALNAMSSQLSKAQEIRDNTASARYPVANPFQGMYRSEMSSYLSSPTYPGNSAKAWYLLADPRDAAVIEVAFLNGQESPTIETADADFNTLGIQMRGYHDFGVAMQDPRGGVKSKGEA